MLVAPRDKEIEDLVANYVQRMSNYALRSEEDTPHRNGTITCPLRLTIFGKVYICSCGCICNKTGDTCGTKQNESNNERKVSGNMFHFWNTKYINQRSRNTVQCGAVQEFSNEQRVLFTSKALHTVQRRMGKLEDSFKHLKTSSRFNNAPGTTLQSSYR